MRYGDRVTATAVLRRRWVGRSRKVWKREPQQVQGIFLGFRTLSDGSSEYWYEEGHVYSPESYFRAALVSPGERQNPIYVPLDCITEAER